jgi:hypothetical protein
MFHASTLSSVFDTVLRKLIDPNDYAIKRKSENMVYKDMNRSFPSILYPLRRGRDARTA